MFLKLLLLGFSLYVFVKVETVQAKNGKHIICYHGTWSTYRQSQGKYDVANIDPFLCTHLMYAFFGIEENGDLRIIDPYLDLEENSGRGNIKKFNQLKLKNPTLKTLAAIGGWNEGSKNFSIVANDAVRRKRFVQSVVKFVQRHGFDGIDLDWEYPQQRNSLNNDDRKNFVTLLKELREGLSPFGYLLTAAVGSAEFSASVSYNIPEVVKYLDIINVMAYDLHGFWDETIGINAPLYAGPMDKTPLAKQINVDSIMKYWVSQGAPREKLVLGVPFYGRSFTLADATKNEPGSAHIGRGLAGQYSVEPGVIGYNELCERMQQEDWTVKWESTQMVPYAFRDNQWVGYESPQSISMKAQYVVDNGYAGVMVWSVESDDFRGTCGDQKYPLLRTINSVLYEVSPSGITTESHGLKPPRGGTTNKEVTVSTSTENWSHHTLEHAGPFECVAEQGYMRNPESCSKFYICDNGVAHSFSCPEPLHFDLSILACNYANLVDC